jgi:hypothetical protein
MITLLGCGKNKSTIILHSACMLLKYTGTFVFYKGLRTFVISNLNTPETTEQIVICT